MFCCFKIETGLRVIAVVFSVLMGISLPPTILCLIHMKFSVDNIILGSLVVSMALLGIYRFAISDLKLKEGRENYESANVTFMGFILMHFAFDWVYFDFLVKTG